MRELTVAVRLLLWLSDPACVPTAVRRMTSIEWEGRRLEVEEGGPGEEEDEVKKEGRRGPSPPPTFFSVRTGHSQQI